MEHGAASCWKGSVPGTVPQLGEVSPSVERTGGFKQCKDCETKRLQQKHRLQAVAYAQKGARVVICRPKPC